MQHSGPQLDDMIRTLQIEQSLTPELMIKIEDIGKKFLTAQTDRVQTYFELEAQAQKLGIENSKIYINGSISRLENYLDSNNAEVRYEIAKTILPYIENLNDKSDLAKYIQTHEKASKDILENVNKGFPVIAITTDNFKQVLKDERFKSQFETKSSKGLYDRTMRLTEEVEQGRPVNLPNKDRIIYGYLASQISVDANSSPDDSGKPSDRYTVNASSVSQYGEIRVVLNDDVKERTTYTLMDSLGKGSLPQKLSETSSRENLVSAGIHSRSNWGNSGKQYNVYTEVQIGGGVKVQDIKQIYIVNNFQTPASERERQVKEVKDMLVSSGYKNLSNKVEYLPSKDDEND